MARFGNVIKYRVNRRGRPRELNIDKAIADLYEADVKSANIFKEIRETTKGYRSERLLGSKTSTPHWVQESMDLLTGALSGRDLSVEDIEQIKRNISDLQQLGSSRKSVMQKGYASLVDRITTEYEESLEDFAKWGRKITKQNVASIKQRLAEMSAKEKGDFFFSSHYQDPKTMETYKRVQRWASADSGVEMTTQESWSYLFARRLEDGLDL